MRCIALTAAAIVIRLPSITSAWSFGKPPCLTTTRKQQSAPPPRLNRAATASDDDDTFSKQAQQAEARQSSDSNDIVNVDGEVQPKAVYGVSYIGGDPCGSKYNDDPFDASADISKPGMPDDAKERIRLLAEKLKNKNKGKD